ncbi:MAG: flagellar protein FlaG [Bacillota bacterium]
MRIQGMDAAFLNPAAVTGVKAEANETVHVSVQKGDNNLPNGNTDEKEYPVTGKFISEAVEKLNRMFEESNRRFEYSVHEKTNSIIIRVINEATNEVVREIPPEKILDIMASIMELAGLIVDERR